jgi:hypothetical protein
MLKVVVKAARVALFYTSCQAPGRSVHWATPNPGRGGRSDGLGALASMGQLTRTQIANFTSHFASEWDSMQRWSAIPDRATLNRNCRVAWQKGVHGVANRFLCLPLTISHSSTTIQCKLWGPISWLSRSLMCPEKRQYRSVQTGKQTCSQCGSPMLDRPGVAEHEKNSNGVC